MHGSNKTQRITVLKDARDREKQVINEWIKISLTSDFFILKTKCWTAMKQCLQSSEAKWLSSKNSVFCEMMRSIRHESRIKTLLIYETSLFTSCAPFLRKSDWGCKPETRRKMPEAGSAVQGTVKVSPWMTALGWKVLERTQDSQGIQCPRRKVPKGERELKRLRSLKKVGLR